MCVRGGGARYDRVPNPVLSLQWLQLALCAGVSILAQNDSRQQLCAASAIFLLFTVKTHTQVLDALPFLKFNFGPEKCELNTRWYGTVGRALLALSQISQS